MGKIKVKVGFDDLTAMIIKIILRAKKLSFQCQTQAVVVSIETTGFERNRTVVCHETENRKFKAQ